MQWWGARRKQWRAESRAIWIADRELVARARVDPRAFRVIYRRYFLRTYHHVLVRVRDAEFAEILTNQIFIRAQRQIRAHGHSGSIGLWIQRLAFQTLAEIGYTDQRPLGPAADNGLESAGRPDPLRPTRPTLSAAVAVPVSRINDGPGIVYALGRQHA
jgi:hypothetical protein